MSRHRGSRGHPRVGGEAGSHAPGTGWRGGSATRLRPRSGRPRRDAGRPRPAFDGPEKSYQIVRRQIDDRLPVQQSTCPSCRCRCSGVGQDGYDRVGVVKRTATLCGTGRVIGLASGWVGDSLICRALVGGCLYGYPMATQPLASRSFLVNIRIYRELGLHCESSQKTRSKRPFRGI